MVSNRRKLRRIPRRLPPWLRRIRGHASLDRMPEMRGVSARVKQKHRTPDVPHRHMPVHILLGQGLALSALRMADGDQKQEERGHPRKKSAVPRRFRRNQTARSAASRCSSASSRPAMTDAGASPYTMPAHAISNHCYRGYAHATKRRRWRTTSTSTGARPWPPSRTRPTVHTAAGRPNAHGTIRPTYDPSAAKNATNRTTAYPTTS